MVLSKRVTRLRKRSVVPKGANSTNDEEESFKEIEESVGRNSEAYCAADARTAEYASAIPSALEFCERHKTTNSGTIFGILNPLNGHRDCEGKVKSGKHAQLAEFRGGYLRYCPEFSRSC